MSAYDSNYFKNKKSDLDLSVYLIENLLHGWIVLRLYFGMKYWKWLLYKKIFSTKIRHIQSTFLQQIIVYCKCLRQNLQAADNLK